MPTTQIDLGALQNAERHYRTKLQTQPDNTTARLNLAWCLFMLAVHRSGVETALSAGVECSPLPMNPVENSGTNRDAQAILHDVLAQVCIVRNLSVHKNDMIDANRLQSLVNLSGLQEAARRAEELSLEGLYDLSWEIMHGSRDEDRESPGEPQ